VFENRLLSKTFGPKREEVTIQWETLDYEEVRYLCSAENAIRVIKST
jgi:hypothetical protein